VKGSQWQGHEYGNGATRSYTIIIYNRKRGKRRGEKKRKKRVKKGKDK
jgi:hypothetical protein